MLRAYVAAPMDAVTYACRFAEQVNAIEGCMTCSSWHFDVANSGEISDPVDALTRQQILSKNLMQIGLSDVVVVLGSKGTPKATNSEAGYAVGIGKPIVWLVRRNNEGSNIFDSHPSVIRVVTVEQALAELQQRVAARRTA